MPLLQNPINFPRITNTRTNSLLGCLAALSLNFDAAYAMPVLNPISLSSQKVNLIQTAASQSDGQTISTQPATQQPAVQEPANPCHQKLKTFFSKENLKEDPADTVVTFIDEYCLEAAGFMTKQTVPYFCFNTGMVLAEKIKAKQKIGVDEMSLIADYCAAMDTKQFTGRTNFMSDILEGKNCSAVYNETYAGTIDDKFDPLSHVLQPKQICEEIIDEVNTLIGLNQPDLQNSAVRFSYMITQFADLEAEQITAFANCSEHEARNDPTSVCLDIITTPNQFGLYSDPMKAEVCTRTIEELSAVSERALTNQTPPPDRCGLIVSQTYQSYGWYLQDLNDMVVASLTQEMNKMLLYQSEYYKEHREQEEVSLFLKEAQGKSVVQQTQELYKQINDLNAKKEADAVQQAQNLVVDAQATLKEIAKTEQDAKIQAEAAEAAAKAKEEQALQQQQANAVQAGINELKNQETAEFNEKAAASDNVKAFLQSMIESDNEAVDNVDAALSEMAEEPAANLSQMAPQTANIVENLVPQQAAQGSSVQPAIQQQPQAQYSQAQQQQQAPIQAPAQSDQALMQLTQQQLNGLQNQAAQQASQELLPQQQQYVQTQSNAQQAQPTYYQAATPQTYTQQSAQQANQIYTQQAAQPQLYAQAALNNQLANQQAAQYQQLGQLQAQPQAQQYMQVQQTPGYAQNAQPGVLNTQQQLYAQQMPAQQTYAQVQPVQQQMPQPTMLAQVQSPATVSPLYNIVGNLGQGLGLF